MTYLTHGIVLKKESYRDYDVKYTIYTTGQGKITAVAKGAKKITSKLNSHLEFFLVSSLMIANGAKVKRVAGAQVLKKYKNIESDLEKRIIAIYFLEVINSVVKYDFNDDQIFLLADSFLTTLSDSNSHEDNLLYLNKYLFELLNHLGYCPIIRSNKQRGLIRELNKMVVEVSEKEIKSFPILVKIFS